MTIAISPGIKSVVWIGSTKADLAAFPEEVKDAIGYALYVARQGGKHGHTKPLRGFGGAGILEIAEDYGGETWPGRLHRAAGWPGVRPARISEEIEEWNQNTESRDRLD